jgi:3-methyl-2-oxobutanoate hydroxymethyltransferase
MCPYSQVGSLPSDSRKRISTTDLIRMKQNGQKIVMLTAYDALFASLLDQAGVEVLLVGDSVATVLAGEETTLAATLDQMIYHGRIVRRGTTRALVVIDLPFLTYQVSVEEAIRNAGRVMQQTGAGAVKLEGGSAMAKTVRALVDVGIPVMGHLGFTPQSVHALGGARVQGRQEDAAERLLADARALEEAGAFSLVLELIPAPLAERVSTELRIPTIGIGAGPRCDGQVLVLHDMLGLNQGFNPKFLKRYAELGKQVTAAAEQFAAEVRQGTYPDDAHSH